MSARIFLVDDQALVRAGFRHADRGPARHGGRRRGRRRARRAGGARRHQRRPRADGRAHAATSTASQATRRLLAGRRDAPEGDRAHDVRPRRARLRCAARRRERVPAQGRPARGPARAPSAPCSAATPSSRRARPAGCSTRRRRAARRRPARTRGWSVLTPREREVLLEVARGRSNAEIAADLFMAEATVKTHVGRLLAKLDQRDRVQLAVFAYDVRPRAPGPLRYASGRTPVATVGGWKRALGVRPSSHETTATVRLDGPGARARRSALRASRGPRCSSRGTATGRSVATSASAIRRPASLTARPTSPVAFTIAVVAMFAAGLAVPLAVARGRGPRRAPARAAVGRRGGARRTWARRASRTTRCASAASRSAG